MKINKIITKKYGDFVIDKNAIISSGKKEEIMESLAIGLRYPVYGLYSKERDIDTNIEFSKSEDFSTIEETIPFTFFEYLSCKVFTDEESQGFPLKLKRYYNRTENYDEDKFRSITGGLGNTAVFRDYLRRYIRDFKPVLFLEEKEIYLCLEHDGEFRAKRKQGEEFKDAWLSNQEQTAFRFMCYMKLNEFWEGATELKGIRTPRMPLLACNILEKLRDSTLGGEYIKRYIEGFFLQVIMFTS